MIQVGAGMTMAEVDDLSSWIDLRVLCAYWAAVGERTAAMVGELTPAELNEVVSPERMRRVDVVEGLYDSPAHAGG